MILIVSNIIHSQNNSSLIKNKKNEITKIETDINKLNKDLTKQNKFEDEANKTINDLTKKINQKKVDLEVEKGNRDSEKYLLKKAKSLLDSLEKNLNKISNKKLEIIKAHQSLKQEISDYDKNIKMLNDSIAYIDSQIKWTLDSLNNLKIKQTIITNNMVQYSKPKDFQFFFESHDWKEYKIQSTLYNMLTQKNKKINAELIEEEILIKSQNKNVNKLKKSILFKKTQMLSKINMLEKEELDVDEKYKNVDEKIKNKSNITNL